MSTSKHISLEEIADLEHFQVDTLLDTVPATYLFHPTWDNLSSDTLKAMLIFYKNELDILNMNDPELLYFSYTTLSRKFSKEKLLLLIESTEKLLTITLQMEEAKR